MESLKPASGVRRIYSVDWLRFIIVCSLVPFHAALSYTGDGDTYVYLPSIFNGIISGTLDRSLTPFGLRAFTMFLDNWFMYFLFFAAGIAIFYSLQKRGVKGFIRERIIKLLLPLLAGSFLAVVPFLAWMKNITHFNYDKGFFSFYIEKYFNGIQGSFPEANFSWAHLWFLVYLFTFSLIYLPVLIKLIKKDYSPRFTGGRLVIYVLVIVVLELLLRPYFPGFQTLISDWANFTEYSFILFLGFLFGRQDGFREYLKTRWKVILSVGVLFITLRIIIMGINIDNFLFGVLSLSLRGLSILPLVLGFFGMGLSLLNKDGKVYRYICGASFTVYFFHFIPVTFFTLILIKTDLHYLVKFGITVVLSYLTLLFFYEIIRRIPGLNNFFSCQKVMRKK